MSHGVTSPVKGLRTSVRDNRLCFPVHIQPRASRDEISGLHGDALKIRLTAPAVENRANRKLVGFLSDVLAVPQDRIEIVTGTKSRTKTVAVRDFDASELLDRITQYLVGSH